MSAWAKINGNVLNQGDLLRGLTIPTVRETFPDQDAQGNVPVDTIQSDIIIMSQTCDLELGKLPNVITAQVFSVAEFEAKNPDYKTKGKWTHVVRGRVESLHLLSCPDAACGNDSWDTTQASRLGQPLTNPQHCRRMPFSAGGGCDIAPVQFLRRFSRR